MTAQNVQKVWHIFHYNELFRAKTEAGREIQKVQYSQRPIVGWNEYSEQYLQQIAALRQTLRFEQFLLAKHVFEEMLDRSQKHHNSNRYLRGFVLDERLLPADAKKIAAMVGCDKKTMDRCLSWLDKVGLIEQVGMPEKPKIQENGDNEEVGGGTSTGVQERVKGNGNGKENNNNTGKPGKGKKNTNPNPKGQGELDLQGQVGQLVTKPERKPGPEEERQAAASPPTAQTGENPNPKGDPTKTDGGVTEACHDAHAGRTQLESTSLARDCLGFAEEVYRRLGLQPTEKNPMAAEIEAWSNAWRRSIAANPSTQWLLSFRGKVLKKADKLRNRRAPGNKSAILMHELNKRILAGKAV